MSPPVFRFAPSPNGLLHLGHARSAIINWRMAQAMGGRFLLRVEDIDTRRCTPELEQQMMDDLAWLGLRWEEPVRRQSAHFTDYRHALDVLRDAGLAYPSFMSRGEIKRAIAERGSTEPWPTDPDGAPVYPGGERDWAAERQEAELRERGGAIWRLNMAAARAHVGGDLYFQELGVSDETYGAVEGLRESDRHGQAERWGDVVLARADTPTSYHLSVVVDDALQGVTHVVRGADLFAATGVHRMLQTLLGLPAPLYHHHTLVLADDGRKLSKSARDTSLKSLREAGLTVRDVEVMAGLAPWGA